MAGHETVAHIDNAGEGNTDLTKIQTQGSSVAKPRMSFAQRMKPYRETYTSESLVKMILRPIFVLINPVVSWSILVIGFTSVWVIGISFVVAQIFAAPPYLLDAAQLGYIAAGPVVGGVLGCILCGWVSDPIVRWISRRNNGVYEPEFRLPLMAGVPISCGIGYFLFGYFAANGASAVGSAAMWGVAFVSVQMAQVSAGAYLVDAFRKISVEIFIITMTVKNFLWFGFSCKFAPERRHRAKLTDFLLVFLNDWIASWGPEKMFYTIGGIQLALSLTTIPVYIFGKRMRAWWHSHDVFSKL